MLFVLVAVIQAWLIMPHGLNLARDPYRSQERKALLKAVVDDPSPATKAAYEEERQRDLQFIQHREFVRFAPLMTGLLVLDGIVLSLFWIYTKRKRYA
jgi:hypothetical protein